MSQTPAFKKFTEKKLWEIALQLENLDWSSSQLYLLHETSSLEDICLLTACTVQTAKHIMAILEIQRRLCQHQPLYPQALHSPTCVYRYLHSLGTYEQETIRALYLDSQLRLIQDRVIAIGSLNAAHVEPRELLRPAFIANAHTYILAHNHPSGDLTASETDIEFTKYIADTSHLFQMPLQDHLIITRTGFVSLRQKYPEIFK